MVEVNIAGPYQCEICQQITDTKQEFVTHIKSLHKDMVDEQVLRYNTVVFLYLNKQITRHNPDPKH
jgi:hypothetical protein